MKTIFRTVCFATVCTMAALSLTPSAHAAPPAPESVTVRYGDLNLANTHGADLMLRRVKRAADRVCGRDVAFQYRAELRRFKECRQASIAATVVELDAPVVSAQYIARYGQPATAHLASQGRHAGQSIG